MPGTSPIQYTENISGQLKNVGTVLADLAEVMSGISPFEPTPERPTLNGLPAFTGTILRYGIERGEPAFVRYDRRLTVFRPMRCFNGPRILLTPPERDGTTFCGVFTDESFATGSNVLSIIPRPGRYHPYYILGILNSRVLGESFTENRDGPLTVEHVAELPIPTINFMNRNEKARHRALVAAVERLLYLQRERRSGKPDWANPVLDRQIGEADDRVEELVRDLFGLSKVHQTSFLPL